MSSQTSPTESLSSGLDTSLNQRLTETRSAGFFSESKPRSMRLAEFSLIADALVRATPLIITGLAVAFAFRGGVFNIGAEGQLLVGATAGTAVSLWAGPALGGFTIII